MDETGKLIFNCLASRKAVWLPEIGTLRVEFTPARENGDGTLTPPCNVVVFAPGRGDDALSILDMIPQQPGGQTPSEQYGRWLAKVTERGPVVIEGIGVVNDSIFTPYQSLVNALNPIPAADGVKVKPAARKGLSRTEKIWLTLIALFILILAGGWSWWKYQNGGPSGTDRWNVKNSAVTDDMDRIPEYTGTVDGKEAIVEESEGVVEMQPAEARPQPVGQAPRAEGAAAQNAAPGFYVVGNVFTVPENADRYIREMQKKYPDLEYVKHPYQGSKTLVSLYHSADRAEANRQRRRIEDRILVFDLWLYEVK
ncbi:MAG: SPOR domain-containing protein [Rikenellaceae bacterium]|nr:SPOR domain-containing protein [Rikenellaceae bacterium]